MWGGSTSVYSGIGYGIHRTVDPATDAVPLEGPDGLKKHLRVEHDADDGYIESLGRAACAAIEAKTLRALVTSTWVLSLDAFPPAEIILPRTPLIAVTSVTYYDLNNVQQTLAASDYEVPLGRPVGSLRRTILSYWPVVYLRADAVAVTFTAGYGGAASVPEPYKHAIRFLAGHWYRNREGIIPGKMEEIPQGFEWLITSLADGRY